VRPRTEVGRNSFPTSPTFPVYGCPDGQKSVWARHTPLYFNIPVPQGQGTKSEKRARKVSYLRHHAPPWVFDPEFRPAGWDAASQGPRRLPLPPHGGSYTRQSNLGFPLPLTCPLFTRPALEYHDAPVAQIEDRPPGVLHIFL
jgi:hypothetical protein